jgi:hypothetical protein
MGGAVISAVGLIVVITVVGVGGALLAVSGWAQPAPTLAGTLRRLRRVAQPDAAAVRGGAAAALGARIVGVLERQPRLVPTVVQLRLVERSPEGHATMLCAAAVAGFVVPGALIGLLQWAGLLGLGWYVPGAAAGASAVLAPMLVHLSTRERAEQVRSDLRYQVSAYLDVVTMLLAGNSGYEGALEHAAHAGDGRLFAELRRRMRESSARGESLTDALRRTGADLGLDELEQVAATAALSAAEGAPVARTLAAKCATLRTALATDQESEARLRTSRLTTPIVGMALIFMALVIYPALSFS